MSLSSQVKELENNYFLLKEKEVKECFSKRHYEFLKGEVKPRYIIKLPYTQETKDFIKCFRALGKIQGFRIRVRGGGSISPKCRKDGLNLRHMDRGLPLKYAETVRLYVDFK